MLFKRQAGPALVLDSAGQRRLVHDAARRSGSPGILTRLRRVRQYRHADTQRGRSDDEYGFLLGQLIDEATLQRAHIIAQGWRVPTHEVLIALGWVAEEDYVE